MLLIIYTYILTKIEYIFYYNKIISFRIYNLVKKY